MTINVDLLCVGLACYDLIFGVGRQPGPDEKVFAERFFDCGGGPAANAAVAAARLNASCAFLGYLGNDVYGQRHLQELAQNGVLTDLVVIGDAATPLSAIMVKPDGRRTVVNYKGAIAPLTAHDFNITNCHPKVMLFDGHHPGISKALAEMANTQGITTVLDAGSVHEGTLQLVGLVDYVVASEKFAFQFSGQEDVAVATEQLHRPGATVVVTQGVDGLVWRTDAEAGHLDAFMVDAVDTTGAGDAFHGAFAAGIAFGMAWHSLLRYASATAALCCRAFGARLGLPSHRAVNEFLKANSQPRPL